MKSLRLYALAILALCTAGITPAFAGKKPVEPPPVDKRTIVKSVDAAHTTVVLEIMRTKSEHTYKIDDITVVKYNNSPAKFADIKSGMLASDMVERDNDTLDSITVQEDNTPKPDAKKKKK